VEFSNLLVRLFIVDGQSIDFRNNINKFSFCYTVKNEEIQQIK